jgi:hypothetical protein
MKTQECLRSLGTSRDVEGLQEVPEPRRRLFSAEGVAPRRGQGVAERSAPVRRRRPSDQGRVLGLGRDADMAGGMPRRIHHAAFTGASRPVCPHGEEVVTK